MSDVGCMDFGQEQDCRSVCERIWLLGGLEGGGEGSFDCFFFIARSLATFSHGFFFTFFQRIRVSVCLSASV